MVSHDRHYYCHYHCFTAFMQDNLRYLAPQLRTRILLEQIVAARMPLLNSNWCIPIRKTTLEFSSVVLPALSPYHQS